MYKIILSVICFVLALLVCLFWSVAQQGSFNINLRYTEDRVFSLTVISLLGLAIFFLRKYIQQIKN